MLISGIFFSAIWTSVPASFKCLAARSINMIIEDYISRTGRLFLLFLLFTAARGAAFTDMVANTFSRFCQDVADHA